MANDLWLLPGVEAGWDGGPSPRRFAGAGTREREGRDPHPSAGIVDSQSVKGADTVSKDTRGYDAGKKINGRKRHIVTDTLVLLLVVMVTAASVQDRDGGRGILKRLHQALDSVRHIFADRGDPGQLIATAKRLGDRHRDRQKARRQIGFAVLPRR